MKKTNKKSLMDHAFFEFNLLKKMNIDVDPKLEFVVTDLIYNLIEKKLSRDEISTVAYFFNRLACGKPLSELFGIKEEWEIGKYGGNDIFINKRCESVIKFKKDGPAYDTEAFIFSSDNEKTCNKNNYDEIKFPYLPPTNTIEIIENEEI